MRVVSLGLMVTALACATHKVPVATVPWDNTPTRWIIYPPMSAIIHSISNANGLKLTMTALGGKIISLYVPDRNNRLDDIVLGYDSLELYHSGNPYFGALIGRYGNRIAKGKFSLEGKHYQLRTNNGVNALHGGELGFHNMIWRVEEVLKNGEQQLELCYQSKHMEEGYPGKLDVKVTYTLTNQNELVIDYEATTNQATIINLTHHSFFNLAGAGNGDILNHLLQINADKFCPVDNTLIPNGKLSSVSSTPFDFTSLRRIGENIHHQNEQLAFGKGYDHNWVLNKKGNELSLAAKVVEPSTGRVMEVFTTEPGLQFYSGNFLDGTDIGKGGKKYGLRSGFCLEAQHFPDSPNQPHFPSVVLRPGEVYKQKTIYKFSAQ